MNGLPYYKAYPRDFIEGTIGMPFEMKCAYRVVLDLIYMQGGNLPDDARYISGLLGCSVRKWNSIRDFLIAADKIQVSGDFLTNYRAEKELETLAKLQETKRENRSGTNKNNSLRKRPFDHTDPEPDIEETNVSSPRKPPKRKTRLPEDAEITDGMRRAAEKRGHSQQEAEAQFQKFKNDALAKGKTFVEWDRAFVTWLDSPYFRPITTSNTKDGSAAARAQRIGERYAAKLSRDMDSGPDRNSVVPLLPARNTR